MGISFEQRMCPCGKRVAETLVHVLLHYKEILLLTSHLVRFPVHPDLVVRWQVMPICESQLLHFQEFYLPVQSRTEPQTLGMLIRCLGVGCVAAEMLIIY